MWLSHDPAIISCLIWLKLLSHFKWCWAALTELEKILPGLSFSFHDSFSPSSNPIPFIHSDTMLYCIALYYLQSMRLQIELMHNSLISKIQLTSPFSLIFFIFRSWEEFICGPLQPAVGVFEQVCFLCRIHMPPKVISTLHCLSPVSLSPRGKLMHSNVLSADAPCVAERACECELGSMFLKVSSVLLNG